MIWIPDVGTRTELSTPFHRKDPFLAPSNSGCYGLLGSMVDSRCEWTKPLSHPAMVARGGRMYGEGRTAPDENVSLKAAETWWLTGGYTLHCGSPGRSEGPYIGDRECVCVWLDKCVCICGRLCWLAGWTGVFKGRSDSHCINTALFHTCRGSCFCT